MALQAPQTYAEWAYLIDQLQQKAEDEEVLDAMRRGTVQWQAGVAERFSKKLIDAVNSRMNMATDRFQKEMTRTRGQERAIVQALLSLRKELAFLVQAVDLPALPEKDRQTYRQLVLNQADSIQHSLEDSAKADRTGKLSSIIRNHRVNAI